MHVCERKQSHSVRFETKWSQVVAFEQPPYSIHIIVGIACVVEGDRCIGSGNALLEGSFKKPQASSTLLRLQEATQKPDRNFSSRSSRASSTLVAETTNGRISGGKVEMRAQKSEQPGSANNVLLEGICGFGYIFEVFYVWMATERILKSTQNLTAIYLETGFVLMTLSPV